MRFKFGDGVEDAAGEIAGIAHILYAMACERDSAGGPEEAAALESLSADLGRISAG